MSTLTKVLLLVAGLLFSPPPMPEIDLPLPTRVIPGVKHSIFEVYKAVYARGAVDGFVVGILVCLLTLPSKRQEIAQHATSLP